MADEKEELTERQKRIVLLRVNNQHILSRLAEYNVSVENIGTNRHEFFLAYLVRIGVVTEEQMEEFDLHWESNLNDLLQEQEVELQKMIAASRRPKIYVPGYEKS